MIGRGCRGIVIITSVCPSLVSFNPPLCFRLLASTSSLDRLLHLISSTDRPFLRCLFLAFCFLPLLLVVRSLRSGLSTRSAQRNLAQRSDHSVIYSNISTQCQNTIIAVAASPRTACLNPNGLLQVFLQGSSNSIVTPVDTWLKGLCALGPCSNDDIASIVTNVTTGCASDLQPVLGDAQPGALTPLVQQIYPTVRKAVCLVE